MHEIIELIKEFPVGSFFIIGGILYTIIDIVHSITNKNECNNDEDDI